MAAVSGQPVPEPSVEGHRVISDRDPGDENDARKECGCGGCSALDLGRPADKHEPKGDG